MDATADWPAVLGRVEALARSGDYAAAAQAAGTGFARAESLEARFAILCAWDELAYAMRPVGYDALHPAVAEVVPTLIAFEAQDGLGAGERLMLRARRLRHQCWSYPEENRPEAERTVAEARADGDAAVRVYSLAALHNTLGSPALAHRARELSEEMVEVARSHPQPEVRATAHWRRYVDAQLHAESPRRDAHLAALLEACAESGYPHWLRLGQMAEAADDLSQAHYDEVEAALPDLLRDGRTFPGFLTAAVSTIGLILGLQRGTLRPNVAVSRSASGLRALHPAFQVGLAYTLAAAGRHTEAAAEIAGFKVSDLWDDAGLLASLAMASELAARLGDDALARDAYERMLPFEGLVSMTGPAQGIFGPVSLYLGMSAAHLGLPGAREHLQHARTTAAAMRQRPWLGLALFHLGRIAGPDSRDGKALVSEALALAEEIGFVPLAEEARTLAAGRVARPKRGVTTELSPREREVLALVARGMTAAEAAHELVLSVRTVEKHLEHAYAKIGARNRAEGIRWAIVNGLTEGA